MGLFKVRAIAEGWIGINFILLTPSRFKDILLETPRSKVVYRMTSTCPNLKSGLKPKPGPTNPKIKLNLKIVYYFALIRLK